MLLTCKRYVAIFALVITSHYFSPFIKLSCRIFGGTATVSRGLAPLIQRLIVSFVHPSLFIRNAISRHAGEPYEILDIKEQVSCIPS